MADYQLMTGSKVQKVLPTSFLFLCALLEPGRGCKWLGEIDLIPFMGCSQVVGCTFFFPDC